jgi:hypothetical protein
MNTEIVAKGEEAIVAAFNSCHAMHEIYRLEILALVI